MYATHKRTEHGVTHRTARRDLGTGTVRTACGRTDAERDCWAAGEDVTCKACRKLEPPTLLERIAAEEAAAAEGPSLELGELERAATAQGIPAEQLHTGGGVRALGITVDGHAALIALDYGQTEGTTWAVALDGEARETFGELESADLPVTSDADQTIADAVAWVRHMTQGTELADGDAAPLWPLHGARVVHFVTGDHGTVVGDAETDEDGDTLHRVAWDDAPDYLDTMLLGQLRRPAL